MRRMLTIRELATWLGLNPNTLRRWCYLGQFPKPFKLGGALRWDEDEIVAFIQSQREDNMGRECAPANEVGELEPINAEK